MLESHLPADGRQFDRVGIFDDFGFCVEQLQDALEPGPRADGHLQQLRKGT